MVPLHSLPAIWSQAPLTHRTPTTTEPALGLLLRSGVAPSPQAKLWHFSS
jgi:hypothetical protein